MLAPVDWLKQYVHTDATPYDLAEIFAGIGFPLEGMEERADDTVLDVEVTSNRGDCQSIIGLAREVAARSDAPLTLVPADPPQSKMPVEDVAQLDVKDAERCPRYIARCLRGVKVGPSPEWLQKRLLAMGLQPRNNIVDITNYVMYETGQPLHAFDHDKLAEGRIVVRRAGEGEAFTPLYGETPKIGPEDLVIADADKPVALAGVVGGAGSEVSEQTVNILLEAAVFEPVGVRRTSRHTGIATDSSFRFERGVDPVGVDYASRRAAALILELAGGELCCGVLDSNPDEVELPEVRLRRDRIPRILGWHVPADLIPGFLQGLGFEIITEDEEGWTVVVPPWRLRDVYREIDLVEEVARLHGYDHCPLRFSMHAQVPDRNPREVLKHDIRRLLTAGGYFEAMTDSLTERGQENRFNPWGAAEMLDLGSTAMRSDHAAMRVSLLPGLLEAKRRNQNEAGRRAVRLFETGPVYLAQGETDLPDEKLVLAILEDGEYAADGRQLVPPLQRLKGALETLFDRLNLPAIRLHPDPDDAGQGRFTGLAARSCCDIMVEGQSIGVLGEPADKALLNDLQTVPALAEIDLTVVLALPKQRRVFKPLPRYPSVSRDVALVVDEAVAWQQFVDAIEAHRPRLLVAYELVDIYRGKQVGPGKKSVAFRLVYRSPERTLTDEDVASVHDPLTKSVMEALNATLRGA